jgi:hypothetical protein
MMQGKLGIIVGILATLAGVNIYNVTHPDTKKEAEKTGHTISDTTTPAKPKTTLREFEITITAKKLPTTETRTKETEPPAKKTTTTIPKARTLSTVPTTPGEIRYLYIKKGGKAIKVFKGIQHEMGFRWFSEDGEHLYFLPAKEDRDYEIHKKRQEELDREILGY